MGEERRERKQEGGVGGEEARELGRERIARVNTSAGREVGMGRENGEGEEENEGGKEQDEERKLKGERKMKRHTTNSRKATKKFQQISSKATKIPPLCC